MAERGEWSLMPFEIIRNDITQLEVDAIINAANEGLQMGSGVCGAIFKAAGVEELRQECNAIGHCPTGQATITKGYCLAAKHIIHTVGPVWQGGAQGEAVLLESCYRSSLELAERHNCATVAFPLISTGIFGYPKAEALRIAVNAIGAFLLEHDMTVYMVVFDKDSFDIGEARFRSVKSYIDDHYVDTHLDQRYRLPDVEESLYEPTRSVPAASAAPRPIQQQKRREERSLEDVVSQLDECFSRMLLRIIDEKGKTDVEVYKRANLDRKLFSKIRNNPGYSPRKSTAIAFAIALELNLDETRDFLAKAGYALSRSNKFDVIIEYFIQEGIYSIIEINEALFAFNQPLLGA